MTLSIKDKDREVSITVPMDIDVYELQRELRGLLIAWGFSPQTVEEILPEDI